MTYVAHLVSSGRLEEIGEFDTLEEASRMIKSHVPSAEMRDIDDRYGGQVFYRGPSVVGVVKVHKDYSRGGRRLDRAPDFVVKELECKRCDHRWIPRTGHYPKVCPNPKCKSPYWNEERKKDLEAKRERKRILSRIPRKQLLDAAIARVELQQGEDGETKDTAKEDLPKSVR
jgi:hypothetical protein